jgi:hypothetical protein
MDVNEHTPLGSRRAVDADAGDGLHRCALSSATKCFTLPRRHPIDNVGSDERGALREGCRLWRGSCWTLRSMRAGILCIASGGASSRRPSLCGPVFGMRAEPVVGYTWLFVF